MSAKVYQFPQKVARSPRRLSPLMIVASIRGRIASIFKKSKAEACYSIAMAVAALGYENGTAQEHLDRAKDELYAASWALKHPSEEQQPLRLVR